MVVKIIIKSEVSPTHTHDDVWSIFRDKWWDQTMRKKEKPKQILNGYYHHHNKEKRKKDGSIGTWRNTFF